MFETRITGSVAVIGDIHGQVTQLLSLIEQLRLLPNFENRWVVFIGDLVDRGPDPCGALQAVLDLKREHPRTTAVSGNHELAMAGALGLVPAPAYIDWAGRWLDHYTPEPTFASYGVEQGNLEALGHALPEAHRDYLSHLPWCVEHPDYFFVHAGLEPFTPFALQRDILRSRDFALHRPHWLCSKSLPFENPPADCPLTVVSGHVRVPEVTFSNRRILIDTTGGRGGALSCVLLPEGQVLHSRSAGESRQILPPLGRQGILLGR